MDSLRRNFLKSHLTHRGFQHTRWFRWLMVCLVLGLVGGLSARPIYRLLKKERALRLAVEAEQLIDLLDWEGAAPKIITATQMAPDHPRILRLVAITGSRQGHPLAFGHWQRFLQTDQATEEDRLEFIEYCLQHRRYLDADAELKPLLRLDPENVRALRLAIRSRRGQADFQAALELTEQWLALDPEDDEARWNAGALLLVTPQPGRQARGRRELFDIALRTGPWQESALRILIGDKALTPSEDRLLLQVASQIPGSEIIQWELQLKLEPDQQDKVLDAVVAYLKERPDSSQRIGHIEWLALRNAHAQVLELLETQPVTEDPQLFSGYIYALTRAKQPVKALSLLNAHPDLLPPAQHHGLLALVAHQQGQQELCRSSLDAALVAANGRMEALTVLAQYAELCDQPRQALQAYSLLLRFLGTFNNASASIQRIAIDLEDLDLAYQALRDLPGNAHRTPAATFYLAYLAAVLNRPHEAAYQFVESMLVENPNHERARAVLALKYLHEGRTEAALDLLESAGIDWNSTPPKVRAIYIAVLGANDQRAAARSLASKLDLSTLRGPERRLVEKWLP